MKVSSILAVVLAAARQQVLELWERARQQALDAAANKIVTSGRSGRGRARTRAQYQVSSE
jgi:hypothetical protein